MKYVECPNESEVGSRSLFLAGGITNCPDWQTVVIDSLHKKVEYGTLKPLTVFNPRRKIFPPDAAKEQIEWEHKYLRHEQFSKNLRKFFK